MTTVQKVLRLQTVVMPGGKITVTDSQLASGEAVEVLILLPHAAATSDHSALDVLQSSPGQRVFKTANDVDVFLNEERASWEL